MGKESKDIDLIVPSSCLNYLHSNIKSKFIQRHGEKKGRKIKETVQVLTRGKCIGMNLIQLEMCYKETDQSGTEHLVSYDLDLRPLASEETLVDDPKSRDFTINAAYYDPINDEVFDLLTVASHNSSRSKI